MRVMGIDPGSNCTGYGIVEEHKGKLQVVHWGSVKIKARQPFAKRLKTIYDELALVIEEFEPQVAAVEDLFFAVNAKSTIKLGQARGVILLVAEKASLEIAEYTPLEIKQSVVGYGHADKNQVRDMVTALLHLKEKPEPLDASDALAVAICHCHNSTTRNRLKQALSLKR